MKRPNPHLNFPDRRRRKRILTLKNFGFAALGGVVLFAAISIRSELRGRNVDNEEYGRLYGKEVPVVEDVVRKTLEPVVESPVADQESADPFSVTGAAREQILRAESNVPPPPPPPLLDTPPPQPVLGSATGSGERRVVIYGGPEGVGVAVAKRDELPALGGGFGKKN